MTEDDVSPDASANARSQVEWLHTDECWRLLRGTRVARLAFVNAAGDAEIYPVNIQTDRGSILIRSADDAKTAALVARPRVAVEADGGTLRVRWSVIVHATAEVLVNDPDERPPASTGALSWFPGVKTRLIRLTAGSITGRRFLVAAGAVPPDPPRWRTGREPHGPGAAVSRPDERPTPIPSYPPVSDGRGPTV